MADIIKIVQISHTIHNPGRKTMNRAITAETSRAIAVLEKLREDITNCVYESGQFIRSEERRGGKECRL